MTDTEYTTMVTVPPDVARVIAREAAADPSDPFLAGRLGAHYRQGIWSPADASTAAKAAAK